MTVMKRSPTRFIGHALVWLLVALTLLLLAWVLITALRDTKDIFKHPFGLPTSPKWHNFSKAWNGGGFGRAALNSIYAATTSAVLAVALSAPCAYALARRRTRTSSALTMTFAMGLGVPGQVLVVPLFVGLAKMQLTNSFTGLILLYTALGLPFTVYLLTGFFSGIPKTVEEAAAIDGATGLRAFVSIVLPMARGGLITAFLLQFIANWNETLFAITLMQGDKVTLPVALVNFVNAQQFSGLDWGTIFAGMTIILVPLIALFSWLSTRIIQGMTVGIGK